MTAHVGLDIVHPVQPSTDSISEYEMKNLRIIEYDNDEFKE